MSLHWLHWHPDVDNVLLRTLFVYFVVFLALRLMGKREIGKLSVFDLVISIMIAEGAVLLIENTRQNMLLGLAPIFAVVVLQIAMSWLTLKSRRARIWFEGTPSIIIRDGKLNRAEMRRQRYSLDDLMLQLREFEVTNLNEIAFAVLETTGKLSIVRKPTAESTNSRFAHIRYEALPIPLIVEGEMLPHNLEMIGESEFWLRRRLHARGIRELRDVFLCTIDHKGQLYIDIQAQS